MYDGLLNQTLNNPQGLKDLSNFAAWASILTQGTPTEALRLTPYPPPAPTNHRTAKLIANAALHFGRDRTKVEHRIEKFFEKG